MASRHGLRFLAKIYNNLTTEMLQRATETAVVPRKKVPASIPSTETLVTSVNLEARLQKIEYLLEKMLNQKRVRTVERDEDALITKIIDAPDNGEG
ncbi:MAG: hypothetical protein Q8Q65_00050 [bacterium]|nr:hypothetical protein [bacterium]